MASEATPAAAAGAAKPSTPAAESHGGKPGFWALSMGSIGVVFGDIGTSPLYAFKEALGPAARDGLEASEVLGVVSLALWALTIVVTIKYVVFLMRADNGGEGGVLSLMALAQRAMGRRTPLILTLGLCGAALFYGDAVITPAISVLSAVEGLRSVSSLQHVVTPGVVLGVTLTILVGLFLAQSRGTAKVARYFGPICLVWFAVITVMGVRALLARPEALLAINPVYGLRLLLSHGAVGLMVMGSVFLTVTGAEALYADMGHFGRWPIQAAWACVVAPALALNYLGQGALVIETLAHLKATGGGFVNQDWFFLMAPEALRIPLVLLAAAATVIASQAVITGAFSLSQQAIQLGLLPRMNILRTSEHHSGQIYLPQVNLMLLVAVLFLVVSFKSSGALAQAYGLAVTGTMVVTTSLAIVVVRHLWKWSWPTTLALIGPLMAVDLAFLGANALKLFSGGWLPLAIGGALLAVMATWVRGTRLLRQKTETDSIPLAEFVNRLSPGRLIRSPGMAVYLVADPGYAPGALLHNLKHNHVLHQRNLVLSIRIAEKPRIEDKDRLAVEEINPDFTRVIATFGYMERPSIPRAMGLLRQRGIPFDIMQTSFFLGKRTLVIGTQSKLHKWQARLFIYLMKNAADPSTFFEIPRGRVVEMGAQTSV
jgi:KUP system potassium uptake protein